MTHHAPEALAFSQPQLNVRVAMHALKVAALWQVLMPFAKEIGNVKISTERTDGYAEITISFIRASTDALGAIADRLGAMTWVTKATLI
jgi:hypothetical protein